MLCNLQVSCCVHQSPFQGVLQEEVLPLPLSFQTRYFILRREICVLFFCIMLTTDTSLLHDMNI